MSQCQGGGPGSNQPNPSAQKIEGMGPNIFARGQAPTRVRIKTWNPCLLVNPTLRSTFDFTRFTCHVRYHRFRIPFIDFPAKLHVRRV